MSQSKNFRYTYEPYKGMRTRHTCPQCNKPKTYTRYIDQQTGEHLPYQYGKCERLNNCGYELNPYKDGYHKKVWEKERDKSDWKPPVFNPLPPKPKPVYIPLEVFKSSLSHYHNNSFAKYLIQLFGSERAGELIQRFYIGSSKHWNNAGATVFWIIDEQFRIAGGQVILFDEDGHTVKTTGSNGKTYRRNSWVHTALEKAYQKRQKPLPDWLKKYKEHSPRFPCLFGLPQLKVEPITKPVAVVESAKTAIVATGYLPQYIWMGVGGLSYLNSKRLASLQGRNITLFPDRGGFEKWSERAEKLRQFANVNVSDLLERKQAEEGMDIADYLTRYRFTDFRPERQDLIKLEMKLSPADGQNVQWTRFDGLQINTIINQNGYPTNWDTP